MAGLASGPPKKRTARRQNVTAARAVLPKEGRSGRAPAWPLSKMVAGEKAVWDAAWRTPQAAEWEKLGWVRLVARYVRRLVEAERPNAPTCLNAEVRQLEDRLGLTPMSMLRLQWDIGDVVSTPASLAAVVTPDRWRDVAG